MDGIQADEAHTGPEGRCTLELVPRSKAKNVVKCKVGVENRGEGLGLYPHFKSQGRVAKGLLQSESELTDFGTWAPAEDKA